MLRRCLPESSSLLSIPAFCHNAVVHPYAKALLLACPRRCAAMCAPPRLDCARIRGPRTSWFRPQLLRLCAGSALRPLWPGTSEQKEGRRSSVLAAMVPRLTLRGKALATYEPQKVRQTAPTLEAVFGLTPGANGRRSSKPHFPKMLAGSCCLHMSWPQWPMPSPLI